MLTIVCYPPGAGGNHFKNILCLDQSFANSKDLDIIKVYYKNKEEEIGEVPAIPGRNVHEYFIDQLCSDVDRDYILQCHFGEIAVYRDRIINLDKKLIILTIDQSNDRRMLEKRQNQLGQNIHPYWLDEELLLLYQPLMYTIYFGIPESNIMTIPINHFWNPDLDTHSIVDRTNDFLGKKIPKDQAQKLHDRWQEINYNPSKNL